MHTPPRYPELTVSGTPRELGRQLGDGAREQIREFCEIALERVQQTVAVSRTSAYDIAAKSMAFAENYAPEMVEELRGTAETAGVTLAELMLLQVRNQLQPDDSGGCTSFSLASCGPSGRVVAQNWDNDPALDAFTLLLTRRPTGKPACTTLTQAGLIAYIGFNDAGVGLCLNSLPAPSRTLGVPHYFTVREILESRCLDDVVHAVRRAERAIPANIMLTTPQGPANLEVMIDGVYVLTDPRCVTHANHCRHPDLAGLNSQFSELIQSHSRQSRIDELLQHAEHSPLTVDQLQHILRDHDHYPQSICRHQNSDGPHGFWQTVFSVIIEPEGHRMHVARGTPCDRNYETYFMGTQA